MSKQPSPDAAERSVQTSAAPKRGRGRPRKPTTLHGALAAAIAAATSGEGTPRRKGGA